MAPVILVRILYNALVLALEIGAIAAIAALGYSFPLAFAAATALLCFAIGVAVEYARISYELPFYFARSPGPRFFVARGLALVEATFKAALAGLVALLVFSGTDRTRLLWVAIIFAGCIFAGSSLLRRLSISLAAEPFRWGYFRLAAPLGLLYAAAMSFLPAPGIAELGRRAIFDLAARPTVNDASEFLFALKQSFDAIIVTLLSLALPVPAAKLLGIFLSINTLTGFVLGFYAALVAHGVRRLEERGP